MEELQRQGKAPKTKLWICLGLLLVVFVVVGVYWYQANLETRLEESYQEGLALRQAGRFTDAAELFRSLHEEHPDFVRAPQALFQAAEILDIYLGEYSEALLVYLLLERDYPEAADVPVARKQAAALYKYRLNDCSQAISVYQKVLDHTGPDKDRFQYEIADCYFRLNNFEQARIEFDSLIKNYPQSQLIPEVQYRIAMTYALEGKLPEAAAAYRRVIEDWPDEPHTLEESFGLATVIEEQEELVESLKILEELAGIYPKKDILERKTQQVRERIAKKKKAI